MTRLRALSLAAALVGWSLVSPRLPAAWRVILQAGAGALLVLVTRAPLGLRPPRVRAAMAERQPPASVPAWLLLQIPVGTVWAEEAAFRAALATAGSRAFGQPGGRLLQAMAFGLSHIADARATGAPVAGTVLVTGVAGWLFGWLADRSGSLAAPMLAHLAVNEAGAIAALTVRRSA